MLPTSCSRPRLAHYVGSRARPLRGLAGSPTSWARSLRGLTRLPRWPSKRGVGNHKKSKKLPPSPNILYPLREGDRRRSTRLVHDRVHVENKNDVYWYTRGVNPTGPYTRYFGKSFWYELEVYVLCLYATRLTQNIRDVGLLCRQPTRENPRRSS